MTRSTGAPSRPNICSTLRIPLLKGRQLERTDAENSEPVVVINDAAAKKYWPGEEALGKRITINDKERTIVGDRRQHPSPRSGNAAATGSLHPVSAGFDPSAATLVMRTTGDPMKVLPAVKAAIWSVNREQRLTGDTVTLEGYMDRLIAQRRFNMALLALFGGLGLVIAAVGIYGVMAYIVAQRTNEIGVRMALGATRRDVVGMVLKRATVLMALGLALGGLAAWYLSVTPRLGLKTYLFETTPTDAWIFAAALATLAARRAHCERDPGAPRGVGRSAHSPAARVVRRADGSEECGGHRAPAPSALLRTPALPLRTAAKLQFGGVDRPHPAAVGRDHDDLVAGLIPEVGHLR